MPDAHPNARRQEEARARICAAARDLAAAGQPVTARALVAAAHTSFTTVQKYRADWEALRDAPTHAAPTPTAAADLRAMLEALAPRPLAEYLLGCTPDTATPACAAYWHHQMQRLRERYRTRNLGISRLDYRQYAERVNVLVAYVRHRYGDQALRDALAALPPPEQMPWPEDGRFLDLPMPPALGPVETPPPER